MYLRYREATWESNSAVGVAPALTGGPQPPPAPARRAWTATRNGSATLPAVRLHGVRFAAISETRTIQHILDDLEAGRGGVVITPNLDHLRRCGRDMTFRAIVDEAELVVADGMPLVWASRLQGTPLPMRVAGSDLISTLSAAAGKRNRSIFLLGGTPGTADAAARILQQSCPGLQIAGTNCPPLGFERDPAAIAVIVDHLRRANPDIVYVGLGSPKQEFLIDRIRASLPRAWWLGVGVSFSFLCGDVRRAPRWMRRAGLEWVHRLIQEPRRLFKRYLLVGLPFASRLLGRATLNGLTRWSEPTRQRLATTAIHSRTDAPNSAPTANLAAVELDAPIRARPHANEGAISAADDSAAGTPGPADLALASPRISDAASLPRRNGVHHLDDLSRLRAVILLGGSVRPKPLNLSIGRSVLDLPLRTDRTILQHWMENAADLAHMIGVSRLPVRILLDGNSREPINPGAAFAGGFTTERDMADYRGSGGVLSNIASQYNDDDLLLVANAQQVLLDPLTQTSKALSQTGGYVSLVSHYDGTPSGLMLVTCKALRLIPTTGFVDMKEQALPAISRQHDVRVVHRRRPTGLPVRTLADYVLALQQVHRGEVKTNSDPLAEDWSPSFGIVEPGAAVDPSARIHDSVVLKGAVIEQEAVLVRSLACPGGAVRRDSRAVDKLVTASVRN